MARTWTLADTATVGASGLGSSGGQAVSNGDYTGVFYYDSSATVFHWDGATQTDISGTYFYTGGSSPYAIFGLCFFKNNLYAVHYNRAATGDNEAIEVSKWNGGTSWSPVQSPVVNNLGNEAIVPISNVYAYAAPLGCDGTKMVVTAGRFPASNYAVNSTVDGLSWQVDTVSLTYNVPMEGFSGQETKSRQNVTGFKISTGRGLYLQATSDWELQYAYGSDRILIGADDDYIYYRGTSGPPYTIYRTTNYGQTEAALTTTHTPIPSFVNCVGSDAIMLVRGGTNIVATLSSGDFVADGTCGSSTRRLYGFFRIGTTLYALVGRPAIATIEFYSGGAVTPFTEPEPEPEPVTPGAAILYWGNNNFVDNEAIVI